MKKVLGGLLLCGILLQPASILADVTTSDAKTSEKVAPASKDTTASIASIPKSTLEQVKGVSKQRNSQSATVAKHTSESARVANPTSAKKNEKAVTSKASTEKSSQPAKSDPSTYADPTLDTWMPDKNLQKLVAETLGISVEQITKEAMSHDMLSLHIAWHPGSSEYTPLAAEIFPDGVGTLDLTGLEYASDGISLSLEDITTGTHLITSSLVGKDLPIIEIHISSDNIITRVFEEHEPLVKNFGIYDYNALFSDDLISDSYISINIENSASGFTVGNKIDKALSPTNYKNLTVSASDFFKFPKSVLTDGSTYTKIYTENQEDKGTVILTNKTGNKLTYSYRILDEQLVQLTLVSGEYEPGTYTTNGGDNPKNFESRQWDDEPNMNEDQDNTNSGAFRLEYDYEDAKLFLDTWGYLSFNLLAQGSVNVQYIDENGQDITPPIVKSGYEGESYSSEAKLFAGYRLVSVPENASGQYTAAPQNVIYKYEKDKVPTSDGQVVVYYWSDKDVNIAKTEVLSGKIGSPYTTEQKNITGYTFKEVKGDVSGTFSDNLQSITYVYTKIPVKAADVTANYVDTDANVISDKVVKSGNIGDEYATEQKEITGYTFKEVKGDVSGTFSDKAQTVTYIYTKNPVKAADVTANYVDTDANVISDKVVKSGNIGDEYATEQKEITGYTFKEVKGDVSGTFSDKEQTVTYVYTKNPIKAADVTANYVDTDGKVISDKVVKSGNIGDEYATEQKEITGYSFKEVKGDISGTFSDKEQSVTYVYTKNPIAGKAVTVNYLDTDNKAIATAVVKSGNIGETYTTEQKAITGYTFKELKGSPAGIFSDKAQTVTYIYTKNPVKAADVTANYVDIDGKVISDKIVKSGNIGDEYATEQKEITGYTFKEVKGDASGTFSDKEQTVTYVYTKNPIVGKAVTVNYLDTDNKAIATPVVKSGNIGETYTTEQKAITGYTFKELKGSPAGIFSDKEQSVTYVYTKNPVKAADVTANYVDIDGKVISDKIVKSGNIGDEYATEQKEITGYTFKEVKGDVSGTLTDKEQNVTYVYTKNSVKAADVTANYVDTDGNGISDKVVKSGNIGETYTTEQKEITGYSFKEVKGDVSGTFSDKEQTVTYVYTRNPIAGKAVTVNYLDTDNKAIATAVVKSGNIGETYTTEQKDIAGYTFKELKGSPAGIFSDKAQTVTYIYTKNPVKAADVTANYVDTYGNGISDVVVESGNIGEKYTTEQKEVTGYTFKKVKGNVSGTFTDKEQTVTYVYTKNTVKAADVTANYVDTDGNGISDKVVKSGNIGDEYATEQKEINGYTFKEVKGDVSGTLTDKEQNVTYVYTKNPVKAADVTANYVDTDGNGISDKVVKSGNIGETYTTEQKEITGYTFKEVKGDVSGTFSDKEQSVTYVYTKNPVKSADVTANYVDTNGKAISNKIVKSGSIGETYTTEQKDIAGYTFKEVKGDASGTFTDKEQSVTYVYTKNPVKTAGVTANYVDTDGNVISDIVVKSGNIGETYTTEQKNITGYTFKEVKGNVSGTFTDKEQSVTYVYTKNLVKAADVTVNYVDTDGNVISVKVVKSGNIGEKYTTEQKNITGYTFKEVKDNVSGTFTDKEQSVTYVYTKNLVKAADVTANYVDTDGKVISDIVVKSGNIGETYTTEQKNITGYTFKEVKGNMSGTFTDKAQTVTYVYTKNPVKAADVTADYVDTEGKVISDVVVKSGNIGETYTTEQKDILGYTFKEVKGNVSGTFTDKAQTVTYIYIKNPVKAADVTANYVDTDGNVISVKVMKSGNIGDKYTTEQKDITGYTFKEVKGDASGTFTDKEQSVTYVYTKKTSVGTKVTTTDTKSPTYLPQTGENNSNSLIILLMGFVSFVLSGALSILKLKNKK